MSALIQCELELLRAHLEKTPFDQHLIGLEAMVSKQHLEVYQRNTL